MYFGTRMLILAAGAALMPHFRCGARTPSESVYCDICGDDPRGAGHRKRLDPGGSLG